jgi:hypothetical protein
MIEQTKLPDAYAESDGTNTTIVCNKAARSALAKHVEPRLQWRGVGGGVLTSPVYRAVQVGDGAAPEVMLSVIHQAGLRVMFKCIKCPEIHIMTDATAERFLKEAEAAAERVVAHPGVETVQ